jgi:subtilisin family serine protease/nitrous oxidase accessory protein NosD
LKNHLLTPISTKFSSIFHFLINLPESLSLKEITLDGKMHKNLIFVLFMVNLVIFANFYTTSISSANSSQSFKIHDLSDLKMPSDLDELFFQNKKLDPWDFFPEDHPLNSLKNANFVPGEIIVKFKQKTADKFSLKTLGSTAIFGIPSIDKLNHDFGLFDVKKLSQDTSSFFLDGVYRLSFSKNTDIDSIMTYYQKNSYIEYVEPNYIYEVSLIPDDTYFDYQWALNQNNDCDIDAPEAWNITYGSSDITIAVIDTGVDYNHPDLADNIWNNAGESVDSADEDGNGYIDDIRGWDFANDDNNPMDDYGHGTHCAGIIGAIGNNSTGVSGVCWNISIMPIKALGSGGYGDISDLVDAIYYAANNSADIISMSWGGYAESLTLKSAIEYAHSNGVVLVAAAGNDNINRKLYPAAYEEVISVGVTDESDSKASFSNWGSWIDVSAPGVNIYSTYLYDSYANYSGTSMACPHVAGIAGLLLSNNSSLSNIQIKNILKTSTEPVNSDYPIGMGRVNAHRALLYDQIPLAILDPSIKDSELMENVFINGTANGSYFTNYSLFYGEGEYPSVWDKLISSETQVNDSNFVTWNTSQVDDGYYTLKLLVNSSRNPSSIDKLSVRVNNVIETYYVGGAGPNNYSSIQDAVMDAGNNDTVFILNGTYNESVMVNSNIDIIGENNDNTIVIGNYSAGYAFWIDSDRCNISNLNIQNTEIGIVYSSNNNSLIKNNKLNNTLLSILVLSNTTGYSIYPVGLSGNSTGGITIANNTITNYVLCGIIGICNELNITDNTMDLGYLYGIILLSGYNNTIHSNTFINNFIAIYEELQYYNCIDNNQFYNNCLSMAIGYSEYNQIHNNNIDYGDYGVLFGYSSNNTFYKNIITNISIDALNLTGDSYFNNFYLNNLKNNSQNAFDEYVNTWYNQEYLIGNYWDDYSGLDSNSDGIGDTPYDIEGGANQDLYPLIHEWTTPPIFVWVDDDYNSSTYGWNIDHFDNIQKAVDNITENGTVYVYNGTYNENVVVNKSINLIGEDKNTTIIDGSGSGVSVSIDADYVNLSSFSIINASVGIYQYCFNYSLIENNIISNHITYGIELVESHFSQISNNYIADKGIYFSGSENNTINNNIINDTSYPIQIESPNSNNNLIYNNNFINNALNCLDQGNNLWNIAYSGNYWDNFDEPIEGAYDNNSDGIVDLPYIISGEGNNQDLYPLAGPWGERPYQATLVLPSDSATGVSTSPTLKVRVTDPNEDVMNVSFYASDSTLIGTDTNVTSGDNATFTWSGRAYSKTYNWYVVSNDSIYLTRSDTWIFRTKSSTKTGGNPGDGDGDGDDDVEQEITNLPVADANGPYEALTFKNIEFDGSGSTDNGTIVNYTWNFGDGSKGYGVKPTHSYSANGSFTITLKVKDNDGLTDTDTTIANITLDTDGDGWSDDDEIEYGSNATDYNDIPIDTDDDGIPDVVDDDDDNDGVPDTVEESIGSNQKSGSDVLLIDINGSDFYLIIKDGDLIYDCLYNPTGRITDVGIAKDGTLLLDVFGDENWDYYYNPLNSEVDEYKEKTDSSDDFLWMIMVVGIIIIVVLLILFILYKRKKQTY